MVWIPDYHDIIVIGTLYIKLTIYPYIIGLDISLII
jgi:hypothetical protein